MFWGSSRLRPLNLLRCGTYLCATKQANPLGEGTHTGSLLCFQCRLLSCLHPRLLHPPLEAKDQIQIWLDELLSEPELAHGFLVELNVLPNGRIEVFLDGDAGVDLGMCQRVSRALEAKLDESQLLGERYTLEISSPGAKRPMTLPRQFNKHVGRTLEVVIDEEAKVSGQLTEVSDTGITLTEEVVRRDERNKKIKETLTHQIAFGSFRGATVQVSFK